MNLPDPTEVMKAADNYAVETWAMVMDPAKKDAARARLESAVRTYGAACAAGERWIPVAERKPDEDVPVWMRLDDGRVLIGGICYEDGWLWARCYGMPYYDEKDGWQALDLEMDDDYQPTHWQPLPGGIGSGG